MDITLGQIGWLLLATIIVAGIGPFARWCYRRALVLQAMSSRVLVPESSQNTAEQRSHAAERLAEQLGTDDGNTFRDIAEQIADADDDALLDILAQARDADGAYRFAESRIGRFIGGRLEDRIAQVRAARGVAASPAPQSRLLRVRDNGAPERYIPIDEAEAA